MSVSTSSFSHLQLFKQRNICNFKGQRSLAAPLGTLYIYYILLYLSIFIQQFCFYALQVHGLSYLFYIFIHFYCITLKGFHFKTVYISIFFFIIRHIKRTHCEYKLPISSKFFPLQTLHTPRLNSPIPCTKIVTTIDSWAKAAFDNCFVALVFATRFVLRLCVFFHCLFVSRSVCTVLPCYGKYLHCGFKKKKKINKPIMIFNISLLMICVIGSDWFSNKYLNIWLTHWQLINFASSFSRHLSFYLFMG